MEKLSSITAFQQVWAEIYGEPISYDSAAVESANLQDFFNQLSKSS